MQNLRNLSREQKVEWLRKRDEKRARKARASLEEFSLRTTPEEPPAEHHRLLCACLDRLLSGKISNLMVLMPPGSAIISIKVDGVNHEFTTIEGVVEDVSDFILNLKEVRLKMLEGNVEKVSIDVKGKGTLKARDIRGGSANIEILNPDLHLATLNEDADFTLELRIERGRGYVPADKNKKPESLIGTIYIDSIFTPVKFV